MASSPTPSQEADNNARSARDSRSMDRQIGSQNLDRHADGQDGVHLSDSDRKKEAHRRTYEGKYQDEDDHAGRHSSDHRSSKGTHRGHKGGGHNKEHRSENSNRGDLSHRGDHRRRRKQEDVSSWMRDEGGPWQPEGPDACMYLERGQIRVHSTTLLSLCTYACVYIHTYIYIYIALQARSGIVL
jgi:hypothetical protein